MWDMETGDRKFTLWASSAPPLSEMQPSPHSVHGIYCSPADGNPLLLTAGSDMRIRYVCNTLDWTNHPSDIFNPVLTMYVCRMTFKFVCDNLA